jgi:hypothetical protein
MRKPSAQMMTLLKAAHRNGGRLPSQSFAYYGVYAPYGGTEDIQAALAGAAKIRDDVAAERYLCDNLNTNQMLMAGGFLDVERRDTHARGTLAERYVKAIRASRIAHGDGYVTTRTLKSCIAAGWLDEKWRLTEHGYTAGREVDHHAFAPLAELTWRQECYDRAVQLDAAAPHLGRAADALIADAHVEARRINHALYGLPGDEAPDAPTVWTGGDTVIIGKTSTGKNVAWDHGWPITGAGKSGVDAATLARMVHADPDAIVVDVDEARQSLADAAGGKAHAMLKTLIAASRDDRLVIVDPKRFPMTQHPNLAAYTAALDDTTATAAGAVTMTPHSLRLRTGAIETHERNMPDLAGAMSGYHPDELTAAERACAARGITPAMFRRLYPAVVVDDGHKLLRRALVVRDTLVRDLTELGHEPAARTLAGDPREAGYRISLFDVRRDTTLPERIRTATFHLEAALSGLDLPDRAERNLARAAGALA